METKIKNVNTIVYLIVTLIFLLSINLNAQWHQSNGISGGAEIFCIVKNGPYHLAGTRKGIYKSTNNGTSWNLLNINNINTVYAIVNIGSNLFAGTESGCFASFDSGKTWQNKTNSISNSHIRALVVHGSNLFAGTGDENVYVSSNNGDNWSKIFTSSNNPWYQYRITSIIVYDSTIFISSYGRGVYKTTNSGANWVLINSGITDLNVNMLAINSGNIYAATANAGVFLSTDSGTSWQSINNGLTNLKVFGLTFSDSLVFAGTTGSGVFVSTNNGLSWLASNSGLKFTFINCLTQNSGILFAGTSGGGIYRSTNNGVNWSVANNGINDIILNCFSNGSNYFYAGTNNGVFRSSNNGKNWNIVGLEMNSVYALLEANDNLFACTNGGISLSTDYGTKWHQVYAGDYFESLVTIDKKIFAGGLLGQGIILTLDTGKTWSSVSSGLGNMDVSALTAGGNILYASVINGGVFFSTNDGANWNTANTSGLTETLIYDLSANDGNIFASSYNGIYRSTNTGTSWKNILPGISVRYLAAYTKYLCAGTSSGVYLSTDNGSHWIPTGQSGEPVAVSGENLIAGTMYCPISEIITSVPVEKQSLDHFSLQQNYPNPFNPTTTIAFSIPQAGNVTLKVFDALGREVAILVNELKSEGAYSVQFNGSSLSSGIYFYRLQAGSYVETKKLVLMK